MNRAIIFDASSISNVSGQILVAPNECVLIRAYNLAPGEQLTVEQLALTVGQIGSSSGICNGPAAPSSGAAVLATSPYSPCGAQAGPTPDASSFVLQQPGYYQLTLPPPALGTAVVEAWFLEGEDACEQAANQCCCDPLSCTTLQSFFPDAGRQIDPSDLILVRSGAGECLAVTPRDLCADLQAFPALPTPGLTDRLVVLSGGQCFVSTIDEVFSEAVVCDSLREFGLATLPLQPADEIVVIQGIDCNRATLAQLFQQTNGTCALPAYSFATDPTSGTFYDPASPVLCGGGPAVVIGFNNCASRLDVGDSIRLTALNGDFLEVGCSITMQAAVGDIGIVSNVGDIDILSPTGEASLRALNGPARIRGAGLATATFDNDIDIVANAGGVTLNSSPGGASIGVSTAGAMSVFTGAVNRLIIASSGQWDLPAGTPGAIGQVITSQGVGAPPIWASLPPAVVVFPLLAPNGSCLAPSYSFTASPDSGMFYTGTAIRISDDNCGDYIEVGASITIQTLASDVNILAGNAVSVTALVSSVAVNADTTIILASGSGVGARLTLLHAGFGGGAVLNDAGGTEVLTINSSVGFEFNSGATPRLRINTTGAWELPPGSPGVAGQVITSGGPGVAPMWAAASATVTFPLLAPTNATPQYSFTAATNAGMAMASDELRIGVIDAGNWNGSARLAFSDASTTGFDVSLKGQDNSAFSRGGNITVVSGRGVGGTTNGGALDMTAGSALGTGNGGVASLGGGSSLAPTGIGGNLSLFAGDANFSPGNVSLRSGTPNATYASGANITILTTGGYPDSALTSPTITLQNNNNTALRLPSSPGGVSEFLGQPGNSVFTTGQDVRIRAGLGRVLGAGGAGGYLELRGGDATGAGGNDGGNLTIDGGGAAGAGIRGYAQLTRLIAAPVVSPNVIASHTPFVFVDDGALRLFGWRQSSGTWVSVTLT